MEGQKTHPSTRPSLVILGVDSALPRLEILAWLLLQATKAMAKLVQFAAPSEKLVEMAPSIADFPQVSWHLILLLLLIPTTKK